MNDDHKANAILLALFTLCRETRHISAATLAAAAHTTPTEAARALVALERAGLVDATRARLTMPGLAAAARLQASGTGGPALDLEAAERVQRDTERAAHQVPIAARGVGPSASAPTRSELPPAPRPHA